MKKESNKNWTTCLRLNTGDGSPRVFLLNSHFLGSVPSSIDGFFYYTKLEVIIRLIICQLDWDMGIIIRYAFKSVA